MALYCFFPLIHSTDAPNVLGAFFQEGSIRPNIVIIVCEGLARAYSGPDAKIGSFTPFLDSLAQAGLYWENFFACSDRTYGALPNVFGSMPIGGTRGVLSLGHSLPDFYSLYDFTHAHGYSSGFYYGGWLGFDGMERFILKNDVQLVMDEVGFPSEARRSNWGVPDHVLFDSSFSGLRDQQEPYMNGFLTLTLHSPYSVPKDLGPYLNPPGTGIAARFASAMQCAHYSDRALSRFLDSYRSRPEYERTIFVITGDHCIEKLDKYTADPLDIFHVPLIVYSPLLTRSGSFRGVCSHWDIPPSLAALMEGNFQMQRPEANPWMGGGLDTSKDYRSDRSFPLGRITGNHDTYFHREYLLLREDLYQVGPCLDLTLIRNEEKKQQIANQLDAYLIINSFVCRRNRLWLGAFR